MPLRISQLAEALPHRCDSCKEHKPMRFSVTHPDHHNRKWHICYSCFRLKEEELHSQLLATPKSNSQDS